MNRQLIWSLGLIGGAVIIAAILIALRPAPVEDERVEEVPLVEAVAFEAASGPIPVLASGTVQARDEVTIGVQVSGRLTYVNPEFRAGGQVSGGATLLRIDRSDFRNDVRMAQADVAAQDVAVLQAQEEVAIAKEELARFAGRNTQSAQSSPKAGILPPHGMDAPATGPSDPNTEKQEGRALATREPQLRSAQAARERAAAGLADARLLLGRTQVKAPFTGLVRTEDAAIGSLVQPGQTLGSLVSTAAYEVRLSLTPQEAALIPGLLSKGGARIPASVTFDYGGQLYRWPAFVDRANPILDSTTRNVEVFLRVPSPLTSGSLVSDSDAKGAAPPLLLGAFVNAEINGAILGSYARVPALAVRPGNEVWVVRDGKLVVLPVRVIQRSDDIAYITTPSLGEGGLVIISSLNAPINGMAVRVASATGE